MTKSGLIEAVAQRTPHISKKDTEIVVNTIFDSMTHGPQARASASRSGASGASRSRFARLERGGTPKTGEPVHISAKRTPFFKVGKELEGDGGRCARLELDRRPTTKGSKPESKEREGPT